jgi:multimeric flavodoxin WrbA
MKILCISASNTKNMGHNSTSTRVCRVISEIIKKDYDSNTDISIIQLSEYNLTACNLCGNCSTTNKCIYDPSFNHLLDKLSEADCIFWVVPHYSPIPSKLIMIFEKINEISYAAWLNNPEYKTPFYNKITAIIGHGGMVESPNILKYYHDKLITPVADTLTSLSFRVIPANDEFSKGIAFGLMNENCLKKSNENVFPDIVQDFELIRERVKPLIKNVMAAFSAQ